MPRKLHRSAFFSDDSKSPQNLIPTIFPANGRESETFPKEKYEITPESFNVRSKVCFFAEPTRNYLGRLGGRIAQRNVLRVETIT